MKLSERSADYQRRWHAVWGTGLQSVDAPERQQEGRVVVVRRLEARCVECRLCRQESETVFFCPERGYMDKKLANAVRTCKHCQPTERFGDEMQADAVAGFLMPVGAVAMSRDKVEKARDEVMVKVEEKQENTVEVMAEMYRMGIGTTAIAKNLGMTQGKVYKALVKAGVEMRPLKGGGRKAGKSPAKARGGKPRASQKMQDVSQMTQLEEAPKIIVADDEPELDIPLHLRVSAESLVRSIDEHNAKQPRFHCSEDNLEEFLRDWFGNLTPRRLYQLPEHIREAADKLTRALFEGRAA